MTLQQESREVGAWETCPVGAVNNRSKGIQVLFSDREERAVRVSGH